MNPDLQRLQPYPFERLRTLLDGCTPPAGLRPINLSIGEPRHATPALLLDALVAASTGFSIYPTVRPN
jgi:N-succinyldiaminopimelate aminotransferase